MFLVSVGNLHFHLLIIFKAVIVISLDDLVLMHIYEMVGCQLVVHDIYRFEKEVLQCIRKAIIGFIVDDLKERWAGLHESLMICYVDDGAQRIRNQDTERSCWEHVYDLVSCNAQILFLERRIQIELYDFAHVYVNDRGCF